MAGLKEAPGVGYEGLTKLEHLLPDWCLAWKNRQVLASGWKPARAVGQDLCLFHVASLLSPGGLLMAGWTMSKGTFYMVAGSPQRKTLLEASPA